MKKLHRIPFAFLLSLAVTSSVYAQQTGISGRVTDTQGAVISGAAVEVKQIGGASFSTKTNEAGTYLMPSLTAGDYFVTVSAQGFGTVKTKVTMLVGQTPEVDTPLALASTNETVVVSANEVAVDTTSSTVAGNITPGDVKDMPINGRNYMELSQLVPGVRVNAITNDTPLGNNNSGKFQLNLDGLQVTQDTADASFGQPRFSPDAISQFQVITNRFDATLGRSSGVYVNVQSKTGTDQIHGTVFAYFRQLGHSGRLEPSDQFQARQRSSRRIQPLRLAEPSSGPLAGHHARRHHRGRAIQLSANLLPERPAVS
jgi:hypothetical protein